MSNAAKILLIEDDAGIRDTLRRALAGKDLACWCKPASQERAPENVR